MDNAVMGEHGELKYTGFGILTFFDPEVCIDDIDQNMRIVLVHPSAEGERREYTNVFFRNDGKYILCVNRATPLETKYLTLPLPTLVPSLVLVLSRSHGSHSPTTSHGKDYFDPAWVGPYPNLPPNFDPVEVENDYVVVMKQDHGPAFCLIYNISHQRDMRPADIPATEPPSMSLLVGRRDDDSKLEQCAEAPADIAVISTVTKVSLPISFGDLDPLRPLFADEAAAVPEQVPDIALSAVLPPSILSATSPEPEPSEKMYHRCPPRRGREAAVPPRNSVPRPLPIVIGDGLVVPDPAPRLRGRAAP
ncbi:hypothetical protein QAD02_008383 [Eretmocerus hayati]|uniref:Uncharacterized protein n=1 Tax=Eretmocerus hayati TaxID=131215 RepID=A0ACC2N759_9HYME|nr:hypothetical protein QAD02_008383 [Eretmocerus hayati]